MNVPKKILHVDDDEGMRLNYGTLLRLAGYEITSAASADEALAILNDRRFDLELWDGSLSPEKLADGAIIAVARKEQGEEVAILSSDAVTEHIARARSIPFLCKLDDEKLLDFVEELMSGNP